MQCLVKQHSAFADIPLSYLALPGAENAGTFNLDPQAFDTQPGTACTTISAAPLVGGQKVQRFSTTQDQTISRQLDDGVRWIDLTVGYNGGGNPVSGWRVVQNLYSSWPLSEYLDQVANWAAGHPSEAIVLDISTVCYDHDPTAATDRGLWANFVTKSVEGAGPKTIAGVAASSSSLGGSLATASLGSLTHGGRNVAVIVPSNVRDSQVLADTYGVHAFRATSTGAATATSTVVVHSDPQVAPTGPSQFAGGNLELAAIPLRAQPALGSLRGKGFFVSKLAYELAGTSVTEQSTILRSFPGLIASFGPIRAWMSGLWNGAYGAILTRWGNATNVVLTNGVDQGGFVAAVIARNGR
jgi:hypothetical protein